MIGYGRALLLDSSAWSRAIDGRLTSKARSVFDAALAAGHLWTCPPALLEMRYSALDDLAFKRLAGRLHALPQASLTSDTAQSALMAQAELAAAPGVSHRVKPVDLLIAAVAAAEGIGVLHYDHDYDTIAEHTSLSFESVWAAPRGSID